MANRQKFWSYSKRHKFSYGPSNFGSFSRQKVSMLGQKDAMISQSWWGIEQKMKRGTFVHLETSFPMSYMAPINCTPTIGYSSVKYVSRNFVKITKI